MSSNLAVINFSVGGTLVISGKTTLSETVKSSASADFVGLNTTTLAVSGISTFNGSLPSSILTPNQNSQLTTKIYVDTADGVLDTRITTVDTLRKTYVDDAYTLLNTRITDTDAAQKTYIDGLNIRTPYYIQNSERRFLSTELGISQFIELGVSIGNNNTVYNTYLPNPNTCSGQIIYIWNNSTDSQGIGQTGTNKFIKAVANLPSFFIPINETYMLISKGNAWVVYVFHKP